MWFVSERSFSYHVVELAIAEMACVSRNVCRTFHVPFLLFQILRTVKDFAERFTFLPAFESNVPFLNALRSGLLFCLTSCVVELGLTGLTSTSRSIRTTRSESLALLRSSDSFLTAFSRIIGIKFWWLGYPCYDGPIAKAMDYTSKGELL